MTMHYFSGYDLGFRPETYWPNDPAIRTLTTIRGEARRRMVQFVVDEHGPEGLDSAIGLTALNETTTEAMGAFHPSLMGGEYLPEFLPREVEIARVSLRSTTSDVISVRARLARSQIHYRIVDEYETAYQAVPKTSRQPLSMRCMVRMLHQGGPSSIPEDCRYRPLDGCISPEELVDFAAVDSLFYPQLGSYFDEEASRWLDEQFEGDFYNHMTPQQRQSFEQARERDLWKTPWDYAGLTVDDLGPEDAELLGLWLKEITRDKTAGVVADARKRLNEDFCAIEIGWSDSERRRVRIPLSSGVPVTTAFARFLEANPRHATLEKRRRRYQSQRAKERKRQEATERARREREARLQQESDPTPYPNYNVKVYCPRNGMTEWCEAQGFPLRRFANYDGGGFNFYIFEFVDRKHADAFLAHYEISNLDTWTEVAPGQHVSEPIPVPSED